MPLSSSIIQGFRKMSHNEQESLVKLHGITYYTTLKGLAFTGFKNEIELQNLYNVKFESGAYKKVHAEIFFHGIINYIFEKNISEFHSNLV